jgi:hypothetical protein
MTTLYGGWEKGNCHDSAFAMNTISQINICVLQNNLKLLVNSLKIRYDGEYPNNDCVKFHGDLMQTDGALEFFSKKRTSLSLPWFL